MKHIIYLACALHFVICSYTQPKLKNFVIKGEVKGSVSLNYFRLAFIYKTSKGIKIDSDSIPIKNGRFEIKGRIAYPHATHIFYDESDVYISSKIFFIESGFQHLNIDTDLLDNGAPFIKGSKTNKAYNKHFISDEITKREIELNYYLDTVTVNEQNTKLFKNMRTTFYEDRDFRLRETSKEYCRSIIPAWLILEFMHRKGYSEHYLEVYNTLNRKIKNTDLGKYTYLKISNASKTNVGAEFPVLSVRDINLNVYQLKLNSTSKTFTLIDFWFAKCSPCIAQFPAFKEIYKNYSDNHLEIITISIDKEGDISTWKEVVKKYEVPWIQYLDMGGVEARMLSINTYPTNFLLDKSGKIIAKNIEPLELRKLLANQNN